MIKVDLHVHSKFSKRPSQWILQKLGCPESFTEPLQIYRIARKRGMNLVTLSDHNTIAGALEIAHLPGTFISEEITAYFPEDGCKIHVLAHDITEAQHQDIQKLRRNVYELVPYLNQAGIFHAIAHPLYSVNDRLTVDHVEKMVLLFRNFEINGARSADANRILKQMLSGLTPEQTAELSERHGLAPTMDTPWRKRFIGGSDDHSGLNIARTYTQVPGAHDVKALFPAILAGRADVREEASTPRTMAHNLYGIAYQFYRNRFHLERHVHKDRLLRFLDRSLRPEVDSEGGFMSKIYFFLNDRKRSSRPADDREPLMKLIRRETDRLIRENPELARFSPDTGTDFGAPERHWFAFVNQVANKVLNHTANSLFHHLSGANLFNIFNAVGSAGTLYTLMAPYFVSFSQFTKDRQVHLEVVRRFGREQTSDAPSAMPARVAHFTDTFHDVNGVAQTLQQQVAVARKTHKHLTIITCDTEPRAPQNGIRHFAPIGVFEMPEYPVQKLFFPPFLEMLDYCFEKRFTHIHSATPGPIGLAGLTIARMLKLPFSGTYHTAFPQYAQYLTGDAMIEELTWKFILWYYDQMDAIYVSSQNSADELIGKGIRPEKIRKIPRGIDIQEFHPGKRNGLLTGRYGIRETIKLLYVGRVSKEKNLPVLVDAFKQVVRKRKDVHLVVVGDGPYMAEMRAALAGLPCTFTGYLSGDALSGAYAASDLFVFPSTTDTFGNVVLEAQASGVPVIVTDQGGPCENLLPGQTGLVVKGGDPADLVRGVECLVGEPETRRSMGRRAREYMEKRSFEQAFLRSWELYERLPQPEAPVLGKAG